MRSAFKLVIIVAVIAFRCGHISLEAKDPPRSLMYGYDQSDSIVTVNVYTTLSGAVQGEVLVARFNPSREVLRKAVHNVARRV
jgi:hypothetical protein